MCRFIIRERIVAESDTLASLSLSHRSMKGTNYGDSWNGPVLYFRVRDIDVVCEFHDVLSMAEFMTMKKAELTDLSVHNCGAKFPKVSTAKLRKTALRNEAFAFKTLTLHKTSKNGHIRIEESDRTYNKREERRSTDAKYNIERRKEKEIWKEHTIKSASSNIADTHVDNGDEKVQSGKYRARSPRFTILEDPNITRYLHALMSRALSDDDDDDDDDDNNYSSPTRGIVGSSSADAPCGPSKDDSSDRICDERDMHIYTLDIREFIKRAQDVYHSNVSREENVKINGAIGASNEGKESYDTIITVYDSCIDRHNILVELKSTHEIDSARAMYKCYVVDDRVNIFEQL